MRLKTLELKGFKSFANETVIHFHADVTGVVGPNGSGKSNVVDAVRWVLGEQKSKELRLDKMAGVIFNGTKHRKEGQFAQVSLTFENTKNLLPTEFQTVTISRLLYRSGESEYRLNGIPCRLKDITSLLMDTGIGPDSYAIIALNMVEDLLSDRDQARLRMFEQAAGISKYKARKHETQLKLEATSADLDRVEDLLYEIEDQLKKLEKQAQRAQKYTELKNAYKNAAIELALHQLTQHRQRNSEIEAQIRQQEDQYWTNEAQIRKLEANIEQLRKSHIDEETMLSAQQRRVNDLMGRIRSKENEKALLAQKGAFIHQEIARIEDQLSRAAEVVRRLEAEIAGYETDLNAEKHLEASLERELEQAHLLLKKTQSDHDLLKGNLEEVVRQQQLLEHEIVELERQKAIQQSQVENLRRDVERTLNEMTLRQVEVQALQQSVNNLAERIRQQELEIAQLEEAEHTRLRDVARIERELDELSQRLVQHHRQLDARRNEYKLTKSMVENLEGFPESIKFLGQQKEWAKNCPLLSDLIYVPEEYRSVIEAYLEPYLNYYVVPNLEAAIEAIQLLSRTQKGRANFFILDAFQHYEAPLTLLPGGIRAMEVVEVDAQYRPLIAFLLENVLIVDDATAIGATTAEAMGLSLVSRSGTFIRRHFILSGGSIGLFEGKKIGRKKNLALLEAQIRLLEDQEAEMNGQLNALRTQLISLKNADQSALLTQKRDALARLYSEHAAILARIENITTFIQNFDVKAAESGRLIEQLIASNEHVDAQLVEKQRIAAQFRERLHHADSSFREIAETLSRVSHAFNQKNIEFIRQQNRVNIFQQELAFRQKNLADLLHQIEQHRLALAKYSDELASVNTEIQHIDKELIQAYSLKKEEEAALTAAEQQYFKARNKIHEGEQQLRELYRRQQDLQGAVNRLKDKLGEVKFNITALYERLRAEFGIQPQELEQRTPNAHIDLEALERDVINLKRRLDNYGEINPLAIEAYNEIKERYDNIVHQRNDILAAKENLLQTMREIEDTAKQRFMEAFEQVRQNFIRVFRTLFSEEDSADLVLTNPANPLESDINIIAKPKGKRPQSIAQLSGGEKTLTATALLFALYLLKPAPFCILDEVDAPLDDANIQKFNRIIREFSKQSQFIIVTHNKATMAAMDIIYGVYMPEQGVSAVTPVDFRQLNHEVQILEQE
ncbi:MAG: chromosome segregation protein SMC [Saprospiraceae bacterium]|nr:chromosome segregation protein SMC [Saprospiraceae bacterium]MDW8483006.1 chromosome segregation protein SMC [Saprospiraceae bacterium]